MKAALELYTGRLLLFAYVAIRFYGFLTLMCTHALFEILPDLIKPPLFMMFIIIAHGLVKGF